jgi:hypothetical protein
MHKHPTRQISRQLIEQERVAVAKRTEDRIAAMQKEAKERLTTGTYFYVLLTF